MAATPEKGSNTADEKDDISLVREIAQDVLSEVARVIVGYGDILVKCRIPNKIPTLV